MHFYAIGYTEFRELPIYTFWEMARNIDRIRSEEDKRMLIVMSNAFGGDPKALYKSLTETQGEVLATETKDEFDKAGLMKLKSRFMRGA